MCSLKQLLHEFYDLNNFEHHFNKSFTLSNHEFKLTSKESEFNKLFDHQEWVVDDLQLIETSSSYAKSKLNNYPLKEWKIQTSKFALLNIHRCYQLFDKLQFEDKETYQLRPELFTRAWIKLYEILIKFGLKKSLMQSALIEEEREIKCLFLCEAPGAFVSAFNHYVKQEFPEKFKFTWMATSLNPYYENNDQFYDTLTEDCFIEQTFDNWYFGPHNSGDIQQPNFHQSLKEEFKQRLIKNGRSIDEMTQNESSGVFSLITADGGMRSIEEPGSQEINSFELIQNEALVALNCLKNGGSLVLKIFGLFNCRTISLIYFLSCVFEKVHLFKPISSKEGNSEIYLVCVNFQINRNLKLVRLMTWRFENFKKSNHERSDMLLLKKEVMPMDFLNQLIECANMFTIHQTNAINRIIYLNEVGDKKFYYNYRKLQTRITQNFNQLINLKPIKIDDQLVKQKTLKLDFRKNSYFDGINKELLMAYNKPNSYAELIEDQNRADKKLNRIKQLISSVYSKSRSELFGSFHKFYQFDQSSASKALKFEDFVIQLKSNLNRKLPKYLNTKLCCDCLIKVLIDYESVKSPINSAKLKQMIQINNEAILNQFRTLLKSKLDQKLTFDLQNHIRQAKQDGDLSSILSKVFESSKMTSLDESKESVVVHAIDLLNLHDDILDDEHCAANYLAAQLVELVGKFQFNNILIFTLPSLFTRYALGFVYMCACMFKQFTVSPFYLRKFRSGLIFVFKNPDEIELANYQDDLIATDDDQKPSNSTTLDKSRFEQERNRVSSLLRQIDRFNLVQKDKQILDFVGIHNLMSTRENTDFLNLIILANNLNLIETLRLRIDS